MTTNHTTHETIWAVTTRWDDGTTATSAWRRGEEAMDALWDMLAETIAEDEDDAPVEEDEDTPATDEAWEAWALEHEWVVIDRSGDRFEIASQACSMSMVAEAIWLH